MLIKKKYIGDQHLTLDLISRSFPQRRTCRQLDSQLKIQQTFDGKAKLIQRLKQFLHKSKPYSNIRQNHKLSKNELQEGPKKF